ncbi:MAG: RING finger protein [Candidatus Babeliales bacterium]
MVRTLRLLIMASMVLAGTYMSPVMAESTQQNAYNLVELHATSTCTLCNDPIAEDDCWPKVILIQCAGDQDANNQHPKLVHTTCAQAHREKYVCVCEKKMSEASAILIERARRINQDACTDSTHSLYQWYTPTIKANYRAIEHDIDQRECSICKNKLTTWPDTIILHANHAHRAVHAFHRHCIQGWQQGHGHDSCPICRENIAAERDIIDVINDKAPFSLADLQKYESVKKPVKSPSRIAAFITAARKYRILGYPSLFAACALALHCAYVYSNAERLTVSKAVNGIFKSTLKGAGLGLVAAAFHHAYEWGNE